MNYADSVHSPHCLLFLSSLCLCASVVQLFFWISRPAVLLIKPSETRIVANRRQGLVGEDLVLPERLALFGADHLQRLTDRFQGSAAVLAIGSGASVGAVAVADKIESESMGVTWQIVPKKDAVGGFWGVPLPYTKVR